jgi:hypothetical protein
MDDRGQHNLTLLTQMFRTSPSSGGPAKRPASGGQGSGSSKRASIPCQNWNLGMCDESPCPNRRLHGTCSECGNPHRAKDNERCLSLLQARRRKSAGGDKPASS